MKQIFDEPISMNRIFDAEPILMNQIFDEPFDEPAVCWWTLFIEPCSIEKHGSMSRTIYEQDTSSGIAPLKRQ